MKKTLIAAAVMAASGVAFAASNVTLYGVIDGGLLVSKAKHADTKVQMSTGFNSGSRWGIKGVEDLGNGYAVGFQLEQGFNIDDGMTNTGWTTDDGEEGSFNRESRLYITGGFGSLSLGRFGTLASGAGSQHILTGWQFGTSYGETGSWTKYAKANGRANNALSYVSPSFAGTTLHLMYSNGMQEDENKWSQNHHYYGIGLKGVYGALTGSMIFEATDAKGANVVDGKAYKNDAYSFTAGGNYNFGVATLSGIYQYAWSDDKYKQHAFGISGAIPAFGGTAKVGGKMLFGKDESVTSGEDKYRGWSLNAAYDYPLSKRTFVYGYAGYTDGGKLWNDKKADLVHNGYAVGLGLVHNF